MNNATDPMAEIRATFFVECEELLESLQDGLEALEEDSPDDETINVVFRAVHSIKGGAGAFGLDALVAFAHRFETVLDAMRSHKLAPSKSVLQILFQANDILNDLVAAAQNGTTVAQDRTEETLSALADLTGGSETEDEEVSDFTPMTLSLELGPDTASDAMSPVADILPVSGQAAPSPDPNAVPEPAAATAPAMDNDGGGVMGDGMGSDHSAGAAADGLSGGFAIRFAPHDGLFSSGNEPLHLLRLLDEMGETTVICDAAALPSLRGLQQERAYLAWDIYLETDEDETAIREIFDFVEDVCTLSIEALTATHIRNMEARTAPKWDDREDEPPGQPGNVMPGPLAETADTAAQDLQVGSVSDQGIPPQPTTGKAEAAKPIAAIATPPAKAAPPAKTAKKPKTNPTVRVDLGRIDRLVNLVGELVINQAMITQSVQEAGLLSNPDIDSGLTEFMQLTRDIQDSVMMIRAQPVKSLFQRMARIVRETSAAVGKSVRLHTEGETTEVDKTVIEHLADPLTHMIRNAVDHGLESPEDRLAAGKPAEGIVTLTAGHRSGRVLIEIADDGAGINRERVLQIAIDKGLIAEKSELSDTEIDNLLFLPGFSTASEVSNLSGRGVGMDVVRSAIQSLGGRIAIQSVPGKGTTFTISLPLTLAVLDGMVVEVAGQTLVVPLNTIAETLTLTAQDIRALGPDTSVVQVRNRFVPLLDLGFELGFRASLDSYIGSVVLLISLEDDSCAAIVVDMIKDQRQVVIKGLQDTFGRVPGVAAATILGDGKIALILDPVDVVSNSKNGTAKSSANLSLAG